MKTPPKDSPRPPEPETRPVADRPSAEILAIHASIDKLRASIESDRVADLKRIAKERAADRKRIAEERAADRKRIADERAADRQHHAKEMARITKERAKLDEDIADRLQQQEGLRTNISRAAEDAFATSLPDIMLGQNIRLDGVRRRVRKSKHGPEFDFLGVNGQLAVAGEAKIRLRPKNVREFLQKLREFRDHFPEHARLKLFGAVGGMTVDDDAAHLARKFGLYVLRMNGGKVCPDTPKGFRPGRINAAAPALQVRVVAPPLGAVPKWMSSGARNKISPRARTRAPSGQSPSCSCAPAPGAKPPSPPRQKRRQRPRRRAKRLQGGACSSPPTVGTGKT